MSAADAPQTLEGSWVLHEVFAVDWPRWRAAPEPDRRRILDEAVTLLTGVLTPQGPEGSAALYHVLTGKGDLGLVLVRPEATALWEIELAVEKLALGDFMRLTWSYFSVVELSRHAADALADDNPVLQARLHPVLPASAFACFYPMNKRRGEQVNWYDLTAAERRSLMAEHGRVGHRHADRVTQIVSGSQGLDDWEWAVDLFAEDPVHFKRLIYEMRFDPASARYAEFGPFIVGRRLKVAELPAFLAPPEPGARGAAGSAAPAPRARRSRS